MCVSPAFMGLYLSQVMLLFLKSAKSWFHLLVSLGDPNLCMHLPYALESVCNGLCWSPSWFDAGERDKQNPRQVGLGAPNPTQCCELCAGAEGSNKT